MLMHSAEKPHADCGKQREEDFASCLSELQAGVGGQVLCFAQYFSGEQQGELVKD